MVVGSWECEARNNQKVIINDTFGVYIVIFLQGDRKTECRIE